MAPAQGWLSALASRIAGFFSDLVLLAVFLMFSVNVLNVLIQVIVLIVGIVETQRMKSYNLPFDETRLGTDLADLGLAVLLAVVAYFVLRGAVLLRRRLLHLFVDAGFASFVSKRYLLSSQGGRLTSLISLISVLGVAVGVMALIVVISVMQGFDEELVKKFMGVYSHGEVRPFPFTGEEYMPRAMYSAVAAEVEKIPGVVASAPIVSLQTIVQARLGASELKAPVLIRGVDIEKESQITEFANYVIAGEKKPGDREVVIGSQLARRLGVRPGDRIYAIGKIVATANRTAAKTSQLRVVGIFQSGLFEADDKYIYAPLKTVQDLLLIGDKVQAIHVRLEEPQQAGRFAMQARQRFHPDFVVRTWEDLNPEFFKALFIEKVAMSIILLLIVVVASFNIIGTLIMTVVQKTREIGILKSMGATRGGISMIFLLNGVFIGVIGTSLGTVWGLRLCQFVKQDIEKIFHLPGAVYGLDQLPVVIDPVIISSIVGAAFVICILASIVPAAQAARLNPVEALRYD